jgi:hypothetical protein
MRHDAGSFYSPTAGPSFVRGKLRLLFFADRLNMMRPSGYLCSLLIALSLPVAVVSANDTSPAWLESVSIVRSGAGSSVAARTSGIAVLVACTSVDTRTVVIELVGIVAERREMAMSDAAGMISHIAVETVRPSEGGAVTRIRVSLAKPYRHRLRTSGFVTYIDFERMESESVEVRRKPLGPSVQPNVIETTNRADVRTAVPVPDSSISETNQPNPRRAEPNLLARWAAITRPLQHMSDRPASEALEGAWIPIVLRDGTTLFSYGDYAAVDGQLAFFLPFDDAHDMPRVQPVTIPASAVDLGATARAAESVRAARYATGRGPQEFSELTESVSAILNAVPSEPDAVARVRLVESVKRRLVEWPATHHGYRAADINEAISILDPILSQLRVSAGMNDIELSLAALTDAPLPRMAFRQPTLVDLLENAMRFALFAAPALRTMVLRATAESLDRHRTRLPGVWLEAGQRRVAAALKSEARIDEAYRKLSTGLLERAARAVRNGNVRAIAALQAELLARDRELGAMRDEVVSSTMAVLQTQFDAAARHQLLREREGIGGSSEPPLRP